MSTTESNVPVYANTVDHGRFSIEVVDKGDRLGTLTVKVAETGEVLLGEDVHLAYGAIFGPDMDDVAEWHTRAITAIDAWIAEHDA